MTHHLADRNALAIALSISLAYDKAMKLLASILMITLLATVAQTTAAQKLEMPPELLQFGKIIAKGREALDVIKKHCVFSELKTV